MTNLKNHPGFWLAQDAAESLERFEAQHGVISVNSAGRTEAEQQALINRYDRGGVTNRPPFLFNPARPASASRHVRDGGKAIDTNNISLMLKYGPENGWFQNFAYDPVHFEYDASRDTKRGGIAYPSHSVVSEVVKAEQAFLNNARGEHLRVDGVLGSDTKSAIKRYQIFLRRYGYKGAIDGAWSTNTQAAHSTFYGLWAHQVPGKARPILKPGSRGDDVRDLQNGMNKRWPEVSKLKVDGVYGAATVKAVKAVQKIFGLTPDGIVGRKTWEKINF